MATDQTSAAKVLPGAPERVEQGAAPAAQARTRARSVKAYQLLADQPSSLAGLGPQERAQVVVSAVLLDDGRTEVISRAGDLQWNLWPLVTTPNTPKSRKALNWTVIPEALREAVQNVLYAYWRRGRAAAPWASWPRLQARHGICRPTKPGAPTPDCLWSRPWAQFTDLLERAVQA